MPLHPATTRRLSQSSRSDSDVCQSGLLPIRSRALRRGGPSPVPVVQETRIQGQKPQSTWAKAGIPEERLWQHCHGKKNYAGVVRQHAVRLRADLVDEPTVVKSKGAARRDATGPDPARSGGSVCVSDTWKACPAVPRVGDDSGVRAGSRIDLREPPRMTPIGSHSFRSPRSSCCFTRTALRRDLSTIGARY